jgi:hypothetical protein
VKTVANTRPSYKAVHLMTNVSVDSFSIKTLFRGLIR